MISFIEILSNVRIDPVEYIERAIGIQNRSNNESNDTNRSNNESNDTNIFCCFTGISIDVIEP